MYSYEASILHQEIEEQKHSYKGLISIITSENYRNIKFIGSRFMVSNNNQCDLQHLPIVSK